MNQFQSAISQLGSDGASDPNARKPGGKQLYDIVAEMHSRPADQQQQLSYATDPQARPGQKEDENATTKAAEKLSNLAGIQLTPKQKNHAGSAVHYAFGSLVGAAYGLASEFLPPVRTGLGVPFGAAVWLLADEIGVPTLKLSKPATKYGLDVHAKSLASHGVYGATAELVRRSLRAAI
jgi:hypothetical protein